MGKSQPLKEMAIHQNGSFLFCCFVVMMFPKRNKAIAISSAQCYLTHINVSTPSFFIAYTTYV